MTPLEYDHNLIWPSQPHHKLMFLGRRRPTRILWRVFRPERRTVTSRWTPHNPARSRAFCETRFTARNISTKVSAYELYIFHRSPTLVSLFFFLLQTKQANKHSYNEPYNHTHTTLKHVTNTTITAKMSSTNDKVSTSTPASTLDNITGKVQEVIGNIVGNPSDQRAGQAKQDKAQFEDAASHATIKGPGFSATADGVARDDPNRQKGAWNQTVGAGKEMVGGIVGSEVSFISFHLATLTGWMDANR